MIVRSDAASVGGGGSITWPPIQAARGLDRAADDTVATKRTKLLKNEMSEHPIGRHVVSFGGPRTKGVANCSFRSLRLLECLRSAKIVAPP